MNRLCRSKNLIVLALASGWILALAGPFVFHAVGRSAGETGFAMTWGIPSKWYGNGQDARPACVDAPENSIGLDFLNVERCMKSFGPGVDIYRYDCPCDPFLRPYTYPPLMTQLFRWTEAFSARTGVMIWCSLVLLSIFGAAFFWNRLWTRFVPAGASKGTGFAVPAWAAGVLMLFSYPSVFSFERGNHDVWVLLTLSVAAACWVRGAWIGVGGSLAAAGLLKVYPLPLGVTVLAAAAAGVLTAGRLGAASKAFRMMLGAGVVTAAVVAALWQDHLYYFSKTLPMLSALKLTAPTHPNAHSLSAAFGSTGIAIFAALWIAGSVLLMAAFADRGSGAARLQLRAFTFLTGLSVYLANTSYDYNLILWIPFFGHYLADASDDATALQRAGVFLLAVGCFTPRWLQSFLWPAASFSVFLVLQAAGMALWLSGSVPVRRWMVRQDRVAT